MATDYNQLLCEKMQKEFDNLIEKFKSKEPAEILKLRYMSLTQWQKVKKYLRVYISVDGTGATLRTLVEKFFSQPMSSPSII